jgi:integrase/recombinase XerD
MPIVSSIILVHPLYQQKVKEFLDHLLMLGHSAHGAMTKSRYVKEFLRFAEQNGKQEIASLTAQDIQLFYQHVTKRPNKRNGAPLNLKTCHHQMRSVELFFIMLQTKEQISINPTATLNFPYPAQSEQIRNVLTQAEMKILYDHCSNQQERVILSLAYGCGLRVSELVQCNIEDIKLREQILIVPAGKFNKRRVIPMSTGVCKDIENYFYQLRIQIKTTEAKAFILHSKAGRMRKGTYNKHLQNIIHRTKNKTIIDKQISIHHLRHSIATHLLENKIPLEQVRMFLGHNQLETTEVYTHISTQQIKDMMQDVYT